MTAGLGFIVDGGMNQWPADAVLDVLAAAGADSIDWGVSHFDPLAAHPRDLVELVKRSQRAGLVPGQFVVAEDFVVVDPTTWERSVLRTERAIDACAEAGIRSIDVITGPQRWNPKAARIGLDVSESDAWDLAFRALERVLNHAARTDVKVSLEPVWGTLARSAYRADFALSKLEHPSLGLTLDPSHFVLTGDDVVGFTRRWSHLLTHVHLKDAFGTDGDQDRDFMFTLPGEGLVDWRAFFDAIDEAGYVGPLSVEFECYRLLRQSLREDWASAARLSLSLAGALVQQMRRGVMNVVPAGEAQ
jgi:sugar phosphate isomerase/epimerase